MADKDDLLLKVVADTAAAVNGLTATNTVLREMLTISQNTAKGIEGLSGQLYNLLNVTTQARRPVNELTDAFGKGQPMVQGFFQSLNLLPDSVQKAVGAFTAIRFVITQVVTGLRDVANVLTGPATKFAQFADDIRNASTQLGVSVQFLQSFRVQLQLTGTSADVGSFALRILSRNIEAAIEGSSRAAEVFQRLGVSLTDTTGRLRPTEDILLAVAKGLGGMQDGATKVAVAMQLFGRQGALLLPVLAEMAKGGESFTKQLKEMGIVISDEAVEGGRLFHAQWEKIGLLFEAQERIWGSFLADALEPFIRGFAEALSWVTRFEVGILDTARALGTLAGGFGRFLLDAEKFSKELSGIVESFDKLKGIGALSEEQIQRIQKALGSLASASPEQAAETVRQIKNIFDAVEKGRKGLLDVMGREQLQALLPLDVQRALQQGARLSAEQLQNLIKVFQDADQASAQFAAGEAERTKGKVAGIEVLRQAALKAARDDIAARAAAAAAAKQQTVEEFKNGADYIELQQELKGKEARINAEFNDQARSVAFEQGQAITKITIESAKNRALAEVAVEEEGIKQRRAVREITASEELRQTAALEDRKLVIQQDAFRQQLANLHLERDERRQIEAEIDRLQKQRGVQAQETATKVKEAEKQQADAATDLKNKLAELNERAFGTPEQQRIAALMRQHDQLIRQLRDTGDAGMIGAISQVEAAYARMIENAKAGTIDLRDTIQTGIEDAFSGVILGTRKMSDVFKAFQESLVKSVAKGFADALIEKAGFDTKLNVNFLETLPKIFGQSAGMLGKVFGSVFDLIAGPTHAGVGPNVSVDAASGTASWAGGAPSWTNFLNFSGGGMRVDASSLGSVASAFGGGGGGGVGPVTWTAAQQATVTRLTAMGYSPEQIGALQRGALAGTAGGAPANAFGAGSAALGLGLFAAGQQAGSNVMGGAMQLGGGALTGAGIAGMTSLASGLAGGIWGAALVVAINGLQAVISNPSLVRKTGNDIAAQGIGKLFGLSGKETQLFSYAITGGMSWAESEVLKALGVNQPPTKEHVNLDTLRDLWGKTGLYQAAGAWGDWSIISRTAGQLRGDRSAVSSLLFPSGPGGPMAGSPAIGEAGVSSPIGNAAYFLAAQIFGGNKQGIAGDFANAFVNNARILGLSAKQATDQLLQMAQAAGITLASAVQELNKVLVNGTLSQSAYNDAISALVPLFAGKLPPGVDASAIALRHFDTINGNSVLNINDFNEALSRQVEIFGTLQKGIDSALAGGLRDFVNLMSAGTGLSPTDMLKNALVGTGTTVDDILNQINLGEQAKAAFHKTFREQIETAAKEAIVQGMVDAVKALPAYTALQEAIAAAVKTGDYSGVTAAMNALDVAVDPLIGKFLGLGNAFGTAAEAGQNLAEAFTNVMDTASLATNAVQAFLGAAFPDTASDQSRQRELAIAQTEVHITQLEAQREHAAALGDTVAAAEYEMQLGSERASLAAQQAVQNTLSPGEAFMDSIRKGIRQSIIQAIIDGIVQGAAIQAIMAPVQEAIAQYAAVISNPSATAADKNAALANVQAVTRTALTGVQAVVPVIDWVVGQAGPTLQWLQGGATGAPPPITSGTNVADLLDTATAINDMEKEVMAGNKTVADLLALINTSINQQTDLMRPIATPTFGVSKEAAIGNVLSNVMAGTATLNDLMSIIQPTAVPGVPIDSAMLDLRHVASRRGGEVTINVHLSGPFVGGDRSSFRELARIVGDETHRVLKQNRLVG